MAEDDAACARLTPSDMITAPSGRLDLPAGTGKAADRLRRALESTGQFDVDRDFEVWRPDVRMSDAMGVVSWGRLGLPIADRLRRLLEQCATAGLRVGRDLSTPVAGSSRGRRPSTDERIPRQAHESAAELGAELEGVGFLLEVDFEQCDAEVTTSGLGLVLLGRLPTATANLLSELIEAFTAQVAGVQGTSP